MYTPFVQAYNYALDKLSEIEVEGLPPPEPRKKVVFVGSSEQNHQLQSQVKPDIVLLQWSFFVERLSTNSSTVEYSDSYLRDFCTSKSDLKLSWRDVRLTVKAKFGGLQKFNNWPAIFDKGFGGLEGSPPHFSLVHNFQAAVIPEELPTKRCECAYLGGFLSLNIPTDGNRRVKGPAEKESRATVANVPISTSTKSELTSMFDDGDMSEPVMKRSEGDGREESSTQNREDCGKGVAESAIARAVSQKNPANIQNWMSAVERPRCSFQVTQSINFVLLGEIQLPESLTQRNSLISGSIMYITCSDRQNVIRTGGFNIDHNPPHFSLVLLILQRFDLARWGFCTGFPESSVQPIRRIHQTHPEGHLHG